MPSLIVNNRRYSIALLGVSAIWGAGFIANRIAFDAGFGPGFILMVRFLLGAAIFGFCVRKDMAGFSRKDLIAGGAVGGVLFCGFALQTVGLQYTSPSNSGFITATNIVLVPFLSWLLFREAPPIKAFTGAILCFAGICVLSWHPDSSSLHFGKGELLTLLGAVCFALHTTSLGYFAQRGNTRRLNFLQLAVAGILSTLFFLATDGNLNQFRPKVAHLSILYLALFSTCLAYFVQTSAQKHLSTSRVSVIIACESLFAAVLSVLLGYEPLRGMLVLGGAMVLLSVWAVEADLTALNRRRPNETLQS